MNELDLLRDGRAVIGYELILRIQRQRERAEALQDAMGHGDEDPYEPHPGVRLPYGTHREMLATAETRLWDRYRPYCEHIKLLADSGGLR